MKKIISLRSLGGLVLLEILLLYVGCSRNTENAGPGNSTEAENALAFVVVDESGIARKGVTATLCATSTACEPSIRKALSDSLGSVFMDSIPNGSYYLVCTLDTLQKSLRLSFANGDTLNLGRVEFSASGLAILDSADNDTADTAGTSLWTGTWLYQSADTNTTEESITTGQIAFVFKEDSSLTYWSYSWKVGYGSNILQYAPSESLFVEAAWNDAGLVLGAFPAADSILGLMNTSLPEYGLSTAHIIMVPVKNNPGKKKWTSGFVFSFQGDSISLLGDVKVFSGVSTTLAGSSWAYLSDNGDNISDVVQMTLNADSSATLTVDDAVYSDGTWSVSATGRMTIAWNGGASSMQGYYVIHDGFLWIMDLDDPGIFHKRTK